MMSGLIEVNQGLGCHQALASYFKVLLWFSVSNENPIFQGKTISRRKRVPVGSPDRGNVNIQHLFMATTW